MLRGMAETEAALRAKQVPFYLLRDSKDPGSCVAAFATAGEASSSSSSGSSSSSNKTKAPDSTHRTAVVFTDMTPLRTPMKWVRDAAACLDAQNVPLVQVSCIG